MRKPITPARLGLTVALLGILGDPRPAHAIAVYDAAVFSAVNILNTSVTAMNTTIAGLLYNIGQAINQNGQKTASTIEAASKAQREFNTVQETNRRLEDARQRYDIPSSICSESASGGATDVVQTAAITRSGIRPGGGAVIANRSVAAAVNTPPLTQPADAARAAQVHAQFCDTDDYASYGGARTCPSVSSRMPGADKRFDTILTGAGPDGKRPDLTFSQEQSDAARMYVQNAVRRSVGTQLRKAEADTQAGAQYLGLMTQYSAIVSASADPMEQMIADSQPNPATKPLLLEALTSSSAKAYYNLMASPKAKSTGMMSLREFEVFEVGRRYANTDYQSDLQAMSGDNLTRELIRTASLGNWLSLAIRNELQKANILNGMALAAAGRKEYEPLLAEKYKAIPGHVSR